MAGERNCKNSTESEIDLCFNKKYKQIEIESYEEGEKEW